MKICFLLLWIPLLLNAELSWQSEKNECSIVIQLSSDQSSLFQPIKLHAAFNYPQTYELDIHSITKQLSGPSNPLFQEWMINGDVQTSSTSGKEGKLEQSIMVEMVPIVAGHLFLSLLNVSFKSIAEESESVHILTPLFEINVTDQPLPAPYNFAPLIALEPQFPLYLSSLNRQNLYLDPHAIIAEQERNIQVLREHAFPWVFLLTLGGLAILFRISVKLLEYFQQKKIKESQSISKGKQASNDLQKLKNSLEEGSAPYASLYLQLTDFCMKYIGERLDKKITFFTLEELQIFIDNLPKISSQIKKDLLSILNKAYYVKFANIQPSLEDCQEAYKTSVELTTLLRSIESKATY